MVGRMVARMIAAAASLLCILGLHSWNRWEQYLWTGTTTPVWGKAAGKAIPVSEQKQKRVCARCGLMQDRKVGW